MKIRRPALSRIVRRLDLEPQEQLLPPLHALAEAQRPILQALHLSLQPSVFASSLVAVPACGYHFSRLSHCIYSGLASLIERQVGNITNSRTRMES